MRPTSPRSRTPGTTTSVPTATHGRHLGRWLGRLAEEWGLAGLAVDRDALLAVLEGRDPRTGERVVRVWRADRVAAHDLVFSAPVVGLRGLGAGRRRSPRSHPTGPGPGSGGCLRVHRAGVRPGPPPRSQPEAPWRGGADHQRARRRPLGRGVPASHRPPDRRPRPLLACPRTPSFTPMCWCRGWPNGATGSYVAINSLVLHQRRAEAGAVYRASLAAGLSALGFAIERQTGNGGHYFEVCGIPLELRQVWSSRHQEIEGASGAWRQEFLEHFRPRAQHLRGAGVGGQEPGRQRAGSSAVTCSPSGETPPPATASPRRRWSGCVTTVRSRSTEGAPSSSPNCSAARE